MLETYKVKIINQKSLLAKLMASENITVLHEKIPTAYFDTRNRTLHCPIFNDMSPELYDLLMGHETGHCLYTPNEGWHDAITKCKENHQHSSKCYNIRFKHFLNVCEDVRIERFIKEKFPGLKTSFVKGYKELYDRDFFKVKNLKTTKNLLLIDRINLHYKVGALLNIDFTDDEKKILQRLDSAKSFDDIQKIAKELYDFCKEEAKQKPKAIKNLDDLLKQIQKDMGGDMDETPSNSEERSDDFENGDVDSNPAAEEDTDDAEGAETNEDDIDSATTDDVEDSEDTDDAESAEANEDDIDSATAENSEDNKKDDVEPTSVTDEAFHDTEKQLLDQNSRPVANVTFPDVDSNKIITKLPIIVKRYEETLIHGYGGSTGKYQKVSADCLKYFRDKNMAYVKLLLREFEMRKNATQYNNERLYRTGELDTDLLSQYKFTNDIFLRITETPKGKDHGMLMFLDMSGSMNKTYMYGAIEQIIILTMFCNMARIPYQVIGFCNDDVFSGRNNSISYQPRDFTIGDVYLRELANSRASVTTQAASMRMLAHYACTHYLRIFPHQTDDFTFKKISEIFEGNYAQIMNLDGGLKLGGTPLIEIITSSRRIIEEFKALTKVDITNVIYLTDGDGTTSPVFPSLVKRDVDLQGGSKDNPDVIITDRKTGKQILLQRKYQRSKEFIWGDVEFQSTLLEFVRNITGCRHIGFYICDQSKVQSVWKENNTIGENTATKFGFAVAKELGFDNYYYISSEFMNYNVQLCDELENVTGTNPTKNREKVLEQFTRHQNRLLGTKIVLSKFAKEIGEHVQSS